MRSTCKNLLLRITVYIFSVILGIKPSFAVTGYDFQAESFVEISNSHELKEGNKIKVFYNGNERSLKIREIDSYNNLTWLMLEDSRHEADCKIVLNYQSSPVLMQIIQKQESRKKDAQSYIDQKMKSEKSLKDLFRDRKFQSSLITSGRDIQDILNSKADVIRFSETASKEDIIRAELSKGKSYQEALTAAEDAIKQRQ